MLLIAEASQVVTQDEYKSGTGGLIFMGLFFLALIVVGIWWLKRSA